MRPLAGHLLANYAHHAGCLSGHLFAGYAHHAGRLSGHLFAGHAHHAGRHRDDDPEDHRYGQPGGVATGHVTVHQGIGGGVQVEPLGQDLAGGLAYRTDLSAEETREVALAIQENAHQSLNERNIEQSGSYGANSPQYLFDNLIKQYANIKFVFSGHVGVAGSRVDTGVHGNKIYSFLQTVHSNTTNPVRLVEIDTKADSLRTWVYGPYNNQSFTEYDRSLAGLGLVR
jgi:hypothetical protein